MDSGIDLASTWVEVQATLPAGWTLDSLRCASESLAPQDRSDDWIAAATGPDGAERQARAADPVAALWMLAGSLRGDERGTGGPPRSAMPPDGG